jgi:hypothetical protein
MQGGIQSETNVDQSTDRTDICSNRETSWKDSRVESLPRLTTSPSHIFGVCISDLTEVTVAKMTQRQFVSLGMFIVDQFLFEDEDGNPTGRSLDPQVGLRAEMKETVSRTSFARMDLFLIFSSNFDVDVDRRRRNLCRYRS